MQMTADRPYACIFVCFVVGIAACFLGLTVAGSLGHRLALSVGVPQSWFDVDFIDPRAARSAVMLQVLLVSSLFLAAGRWSKALRSRSLWMSLAAANPITGLAGYLLYRLLLPFTPEAAYVGPANIVAITFGFPVFFLMTILGRRLRPL